MDHEKVTFFTSNFTIEELAKRQAKTSKSTFRDYEKANRLVERIKALSKPILIKGENLRHK